MSTLASDFLQFEIDGRIIGRMACLDAAVSWPPPEFVSLNGLVFRRVQFSSLSDEVAKNCQNMSRGALYRVEPDADEKFLDYDDFGPGNSLLN